jgi:hypothetical protein
MAFAGFDSLDYPGDAVMAWLKANTNFSFVGFYLAPAPSQPSTAWMTRFPTLSAQGWGFAPIYVGQQEPGGPGSHILTAAQGAIDGEDAAKLMATAGFPAGCVVYLDIETGGSASAATLSYFSAWVDAVRADGGYAPGVYCSFTTAASLLASRPGVQVWTWHLVEKSPSFPHFPISDPGGSGVATATVWQYAQNRSTNFPGSPKPVLLVDLDVASVADPSQSSLPSS